MDGKLDQSAIAAAKRIALERAKAISFNLEKSSKSDDGLSRFEKKVYIPKSSSGTNYVGLLIGPRAKTLRELQIKLNCTLQICGKGLAKTGRDVNDDPHVFISGSKEDVVKDAERYISSIFTDPAKIEELKQSQLNDIDFQSRGRGMDGGSGKMTKILQVPNDMAGAVIGKGGEQIKAFITQSGAHIQIDNSPENKSREMRDLTVQGSADEIRLAEKLINDFIVDKRGSLGSTGVLSSAMSYPLKLKLEVPNNKVGLIIGRSGKTIHQIQNNFRCKIDIPKTPDRDNSEVRTLTLGAYSEAEMEGAKNDVFSIITYGTTVSSSADGPTGSYAMPVASSMATYASHQQQQDESSSHKNKRQKTSSEKTQQKYTRELWQQWREYYLQQGEADIGPDAPPELRARNY